MVTQPPILITGIPRSGTSMIAATINMCGAFGGSMSKRGMYSNDVIRELLVKLHLEAVKVGLDYIPINWKSSVEHIMISEGYKQGAWMYKDSNICQMWKTWNYAYPDAKWVIVRRRTGDIIQSCMKTGYMITYDTEEGWLSMVHEYEKKFVEMITEGLNIKIIWPERMVNGDYRQLFELCDWVGVPWKEEALGFINSLLWKSRQKERNGV
jgi:hypothetical protein